MGRRRTIKLEEGELVATVFLMLSSCDWGCLLPTINRVTVPIAHKLVINRLRSFIKCKPDKHPILPPEIRKAVSAVPKNKFVAVDQQSAISNQRLA